MKIRQRVIAIVLILLLTLIVFIMITMASPAHHRPWHKPTPTPTLTPTLTSTSTPTPTPTPTSNWRMPLAWYAIHDSSIAEQSKRVDLIIARSWDYQRLVAPMLAAWPKAESLAYFNFPYVKDPDVYGHNGSGVGLTEARQNGWLALGTNGQEVPNCAAPYMVTADPAKLGYSDTWANNTSDKILPFDGVFMDDVNAKMACDAETTTLRDYLSRDKWWSVAMRPGVERIASLLDFSFKDVGANGNGVWGQYASYVDQLIPTLDYNFSEMTLLWGGSTPHIPMTYVQNVWRSMDQACADERGFISANRLGTSDPGLQEYRTMYAFTGTLMAACPGSTYFTVEYAQLRPVFPFMDTNLGPPIGGRVTEPDGTYRRDFANYRVRFNPTWTDQTYPEGIVRNHHGLISQR